jgi:hypothetical protein
MSPTHPPRSAAPMPPPPSRPPLAPALAPAGALAPPALLAVADMNKVARGIPGMPKSASDADVAGLQGGIASKVNAPPKPPNGGVAPRAIGPKAWLKMNEEGICTPVTIDKHRLSSLGAYRAVVAPPRPARDAFRHHFARLPNGLDYSLSPHRHVVPRPTPAVPFPSLPPPPPARAVRVPMRDLRMLEPSHSNSYSAAILCRERCMVVQVEQIRLLITAEEVYLQDGRNITVTKYLPELQRRLLMRKLKLMDSHGISNVYDSDTDKEDNGGSENDAKRGASVDAREVVMSEATPPPPPPPPTTTTTPEKTAGSGPGYDSDSSVRGGKLAKGLGSRSQSLDDVQRVAATAATGKASSPLAPASAKPALQTGVGTPPPPLGAKKIQIQSAAPAALKVAAAAAGGGGGGDPWGPGGGGDNSVSATLRRLQSMNRNESARQEDLPFELIALEVALEIVCNDLEAEQVAAAAEAKSSLESLRKKVSTVNLERVRRLKSRVTRMTGRVSKVREEIKRYLDDDSDMRDMYLTRKLLAELFANIPGNERQGGATPMGGFNGAGFQAAMAGVGGVGGYYSPRFGGGGGEPGRGGRAQILRQPILSPIKDKGETTTDGDGDAKRDDDDATGGGGDGDTPKDHSDDDVEPEYYPDLNDDKDLQEVEDLLETYFANIDSTFAELQALDEYIDDTEDFVNIELDSQRNQLIKLELVLTTATLFVSMCVVRSFVRFSSLNPTPRVRLFRRAVRSI